MRSVLGTSRTIFGSTPDGVPGAGGDGASGDGGDGAVGGGELRGPPCVQVFASSVDVDDCNGPPVDLPCTRRRGCITRSTLTRAVGFASHRTEALTMNERGGRAGEGSKYREGRRAGGRGKEVKGGGRRSKEVEGGVGCRARCAVFRSDPDTVHTSICSRWILYTPPYAVDGFVRQPHTVVLARAIASAADVRNRG